MNIRRENGYYRIPLSFAELTVEVRLLGDDCLLVAAGGDRPHLGGAVLAVPRESLRKDGGISVTSSVLNVVGHKDEAILRLLAEKCVVAWNATVVCCGGFHVDDMTERQIAEVVGKCEDIEFVSGVQGEEF